MTTLTADVENLYAAVAARPERHHLRAVLADALEEAEGTVACGCDDGSVDSGGVTPWGEPISVRCELCDGTGHASNGAAALAQGYRALAEFGRYAGESKDGALGFWWGNRSVLHSHIKSMLGIPGFWQERNLLPTTWWKEIRSMDSVVGCWLFTPESLRAAEDAAALAWTRMTDGEREACREELQVNSPTGVN